VLSSDFIDRHLHKRSLLSDLLYPASLLYGLVQERRNQSHQSLKAADAISVIGIGNIVSGGSGKTPFTIALARAAYASSVRVAVSHRGYKGRLEFSPTLISDERGPVYSPSICGDEAWLIANSLPRIPVVVGKDRSAALQIMGSLSPKPALALMDDVFQNHKIVKDIEIVCFDAATGIGNGRLIPAGYLREGLTALKRAQLCVISRKDPSLDVEALCSLLRDYCSWIEVLDYNMTGIEDWQGRALNPDPELQSVLVSGIASPAGFEDLARRSGLVWTRHFCFGDHYHFQSREALKPLLDQIRNQDIQRLYCTAKDVAKLARHRDLAPLLAVLKIGPQQKVVETIWGRLQERLASGDPR